MVFPVVMYGCESWTIKKAECRRIDAFELWWWRRLLRVPWTATRSNQSILKEISPECSLEGLMLKLKLQYFGHQYFDVKTWLIWKDPDAGKDCRQEEKGMTEDETVQWAWVWVNSGSWWWTQEVWHAAVDGVSKSWTQLSDWLNWTDQVGSAAPGGEKVNLSRIHSQPLHSEHVL